jgi:hemolysin III
MPRNRPQSSSEERANAISHGTGLVLSAAGLPALLALQRSAASVAALAGVVIFCVTMMMLYLSSTLYHACRPGPAKRWFERADLAAIYLFIAGSYTPFVLDQLHGGPAWLLFALVWSIALLGCAIKLLDRLKHPLWSTGLYVLIGWIAVVAAAPFVSAARGDGLAWLMAGALCYTVGAVVFVFDHRMHYGHCLWHLFVLGGSGCHFIAVSQQMA